MVFKQITVGFVTGGLTFTCAKNNFLDLHTYPRPKKDPKHNEIVGVEQVFAANKFTVNVGKSPYGTGARIDFSVGAAGTNYINPNLIIPEPAYQDLGVIGVSRLGDGQLQILEQVYYLILVWVNVHVVTSIDL